MTTEKTWRAVGNAVLGNGEQFETINPFEANELATYLNALEERVGRLSEALTDAWQTFNDIQKLSGRRDLESNNPELMGLTGHGIQTSLIALRSPSLARKSED